MICVQNAAPSSDKRFLIKSDLSNAEAAAQETGEWLRVHNCQPVPNARPLLVYENGVCVRQWIQAEPQQAGSAASSAASHAPRPVRTWLSSLLHLRPSPPSAHQQTV